MRGHLVFAEIRNLCPRWVHVSAAYKQKHRLSTFLRLCPWDLQNNNNNNTEINGMKFKRGCFDKIDWNTWMPDWDVNENKRLEIGSTGSFSGVLLFSFFLFPLFCWLYLKLWISSVNDGKRPLFFLIILPWQLSQTKRRHRRFLSKIQIVYIWTVSFGQIKPKKIVFGFFG